MGRCSDARDRLLASASRLLHERGYSALSVADLCADAGLKKGSFYHFFASKQELVLATIDCYGEGLRRRQQEAARADPSARAQLMWIFGQLEADLRRSWDECGSVRGCPLGNLALEMADQDEAIRRRLEVLFADWRQGFEAILRHGVERGEFAVEDPRRTANQLLAYFQGSVMLAKTSNDPKVFSDLQAGVAQFLPEHGSVLAP